MSGIESLLRIACSTEFPQRKREAAFLELMLLIERRYQIDSREELATRPAQTKVTDAAEAEVIARVSNVLRPEETDEILSAAISVLGATRSRVALHLLVELIKNPKMRGRFPVLHAAVANVDNLSFYGSEEPLESAFKELRVKETLNELLPSGNDLLDGRVQSALSNMDQEMDKDSRRATLDALRQILLSDPTNLVVAKHYWQALSNYEGHDVRHGRDVIQAYRGAALNSQEGAIALGEAFRELFKNSGEVPRAAYFDNDLILALEKWNQGAAGDDRSIIAWVLQEIGRN